MCRSASLIWAALLASGVDPVVAGLAIGLTASAYTPARATSSRRPACSGCSASSRPPNSPARATVGLTATLSPNDRLQRFYHPWTSYVIVPLFGLANAGITIDGDFLGPGASPRRSRSASCSATSSASRSR